MHQYSRLFSLSHFLYFKDLILVLCQGWLPVDDRCFVYLALGSYRDAFQYYIDGVLGVHSVLNLGEDSWKIQIMAMLLFVR